jgi:hypothetical protein
MGMTRRTWTMIAAATLVVAALAYLRDPPWLLQVASGLSRWETDRDGTRYRWTNGHASFFVPSSAEVVTFRLRAPKDDPRDWPITATITIDDRPADVLKVNDDDWTPVRLRMPSRAARNARRIDIKLDRVRSQNRGVQLQIDER